MSAELSSGYETVYEALGVETGIEPTTDTHADERPENARVFVLRNSKVYVLPWRPNTSYAGYVEHHDAGVERAWIHPDTVAALYDTAAIVEEVALSETPAWPFALQGGDDRR